MTDNRQQLTVNHRKECLYNLGGHQLSDIIALSCVPIVAAAIF
jgi:hypothetical protein